MTLVMKRKEFVFGVAALLSAALSSCNTEVDFGYEEGHPLSTAVKFSYDLPEGAKERPDSMFVVANRVINSWKCAMSVNADDFSGRYLYNAPEMDEEMEDRKSVV